MCVLSNGNFFPRFFFNRNDFLVSGFCAFFTKAKANCKSAQSELKIDHSKSRKSAFEKLVGNLTVSVEPGSFSLFYHPNKIWEFSSGFASSVISGITTDYGTHQSRLLLSHQRLCRCLPISDSKVKCR